MTIIDTSTIDVAPVAARRRSASSTLFSAMPLLVQRRLWRDRGLILGSIAIVAMSTMLSFAGPQVVLDTIDNGAADAVTAAGPGADIMVLFPVGNIAGDNVNTVRGVEPSEFAGLADPAVDNLPGSVYALVEGSVAWAQSSTFALGDQEPGKTSFASRPGANLQFALSDDAEMTVVEGRAPEAPTDAVIEYEVETTVDGVVTTEIIELPAPVEIAVSAEIAALFELELDETFFAVTETESSVELILVGIVEPTDADAEIWQALPEAITPYQFDNPAFPLYKRGTVVISAESASVITNSLRRPLNGSVRIDIGSEGLTLKGAEVIAEDMRELKSAGTTLLPDSNVNVVIDSDLGPALDAYPARARAALAQMSVMVAGVISVAAVVIALMARLLLTRRSVDIALERARGASIPSIGVRLVVESVLFTVVGVLAGWYGARAVVDAANPVSTPAALVAVVSILASPLLGVAMARRTWTGAREAANRQDRARVRKQARAKRLTLEALAIVIAGLGVMALKNRGVLQTQTDGIDPFLAAAPVLLGLAITVVVLRLFPIPMAIIQAFAKRTRGVSGAITLAKAREKVPAVPLLALTLSIAIAVSGGMLVGTVRNGQEQASWERVGGEVRVDAEIGEDVVSGLRDQGLLVSQLLVQPAVDIRLDGNYISGLLMAVDENYVSTVSMNDSVDPADLAALAAANAARGPGDPIPVLASQIFLDVDFQGENLMYVGRTYVDVTIIGLPLTAPTGWAEGPFIIAPYEALIAAELEDPVSSNLMFVSGEGAAEAVAATTIADTAVTTREGWLSGVRDSALIGGVERMMALAVLAVAILAAVALLMTVLDGMKSRGHALSMLRTQGMSNRYGWWLALSELTPLTSAAVVGGTAAGLAILILLGQSLGLEVLSGGIAAPPLVANITFLSFVAAGVVLLTLIAVSAEVAAHRRNKLSEVLRQGESR